ncbi:MAG TPA: LysR family transcriptional regulator [Xanthobacteraceae bacterium]|jgi:hypothetical protein|nr:LysR family transcriptional regulator [Xanthobacteraceae bacterium]
MEITAPQRALAACNRADFETSGETCGLILAAIKKTRNKTRRIPIIAVMGLIPPLNGLRLFEAAARCGSFKLAAQELKLTPGAVSHGISSLEQWLDVELFDRKRDLVLTPAGLDYLSYIGEAMLMIAKGTNELLTITKGTTEEPATDQNAQDSSAPPSD